MLKVQERERERKVDKKKKRERERKNRATLYVLDGRQKDKTTDNFV